MPRMGLCRVALCRRWKNVDEYVVAGQILCLKGMLSQVYNLEPHKPFVLEVRLDTAQAFSSFSPIWDTKDMRKHVFAYTYVCLNTA